MILMLHALPRSGKTTVAEHFVGEFGFVRLSYGDLIYKEVSAAFGVTIEQLKSDDWKRVPVTRLAIENCADRDFVDMVVALENPALAGEVSRIRSDSMFKARTAKWILQRWATEYRRSKNPRYFIDDLEARAEKFMPFTDIIVDDLRSDHEFESMQEFIKRQKIKVPYSVIHITRDGTEKTSHDSDKGINPAYIDGHIHNPVPLGATGHPADFINALIPLVQETKWRTRK